MLRIKEIIKTKGMTAKELAAKVGVSDASLSLTIRPGANPSLQTLARIADALEVPVSELFDPPKTGLISCPYCGRPIALHASKVEETP